MLLQPLLSLITLIFSVRAFTLPDIITEDIFSVKVEDGVEIHAKIADLPTPAELKTKRRGVEAPATPASRVLARQQYGVGIGILCGCGCYMNPGNCDEAVAVLKDQLIHHEGAMPPWSFYIIRGTVVAFFCLDYGGSWWLAYPETGNDYGDALFYITRDCGRYVAGTMYSDNWNQWRVSQGYMNHFPGLNF